MNDQVKLINDFLGVSDHPITLDCCSHRNIPCGSQFIAERMRETDVWKNATDAEFDNAMEGMEKLVMNRLYDL